jgi:hypothetical protein
MEQPLDNRQRQPARMLCHVVIWGLFGIYAFALNGVYTITGHGGPDMPGLLYVLSLESSHSSTCFCRLLGCSKGSNITSFGYASRVGLTRECVMEESYKVPVT